MIREKTGLITDAYFKVTAKVDSRPMVMGRREKQGVCELLFGTVETWLI